MSNPAGQETENRETHRSATPSGPAGAASTPASAPRSERRPDLRGTTFAEGESALAPNPATYTPGQAFTPVRPSGEGSQVTTGYEPGQAFRPVRGAFGTSMRETPFNPVAAPPEYTPGRPFQPVRADESQVQEGSVRAFGHGRVSQSSTDPSNDLRGVLETRRNEARAQLEQLRQGGQNPGRQAEHLEAQVHQLDQDITALRSGPAQRDPEAAANIARRHGVDPGQLRRGLEVRGDMAITSSQASANGIGRTTAVTEHSEVGDEHDGHGGTREITRSQTTALTQDGLVRSNTFRNEVTGPDGATNTQSHEQERRVGLSNRGLGYQGQTTAGERIREADRSGQSHERRDTRHAVVTRNGLSVGREGRETTSVTASDGTSAERRDTRGTTGQVGFGDDGRLNRATIGRTRETRIERRDAPQAGETTGAANERRTTSSSLNGGFVRDERTGTGIEISGSRSNATANREGGESRTLNGTATVTDRQVGASGTSNAARNVGPVRVGGTFGIGGSYRVVAEPAPDTDPPLYDLVTTLQYEVTVGGTLGNNSDRLAPSDAAPGEANGFRSNVARSGSVSVGAERRVQRTNTFRHRMTRAELDAYRVGLERSASATTPPAGSPAEFGLITRINAARQQRRTPSDAELARDPSIAASLTNGSSIENSQEVRDRVNGSARGTVGPVSAGVSGSHTHTGTVTRRTAQRTVRGVSMVEVTLTFADENTTNAAAHGGLNIVPGAGTIGARAESTVTQRDGNSVVVLLDPLAPGYAENLAAAYAVQDRAQAEALAERTQSRITRSERRTVTRAGGAGTLEDGAVSTGLTQSERRQTSSEITSGRNDRNRRAVWGTTSGESESQLGVNVAGGSVLSANEATSATSRVSEDGEQTFSADHTRSGGLQTPAYLQGLWRTTYTEMQRMELDEGDLSALVSRANDAHQWLNCLNGRELLHIQGPWEQLRRELVAPRPNDDWVAIDRTMATRLARGRSLTTFVGSVGPTHGIAAIRAVTRNADPSRPLGVQYEWPDELRNEQRTWSSLHSDVLAIRTRLRSFVGPNRATRVREHVQSITTRLERVSQAVEGCRTFRNQAARVEMLNAFDRDRDTVRRAGDEAARETPEGAPEQAATSTPAQGEAQADPQTNPRAEFERVLATALTSLRRHKAAELRYWQSAQRHTAEARGRWLSSSRDDVRAAIDDLVAIETMWIGTWLADWRRASSAARELGRPAEPPQDLRTNTAWRISLLREAVAAAPSSLRGHFDVEGRAARWQSQDRPS